MSKNYHKITKLYKNYFTSYMPPSNIKSMVQILFLNPKIKILKIRFQIIQSLKNDNIKCFTGACPEIYLEKSFTKLKKFKFKRLKNCQTLGKISLALDVNHTLTDLQHKDELFNLNKNFAKIFNNENTYSK